MSRERKSSSSAADNAQIDDNFFENFGNFEVVDAWDETSNGDKSSGVKIKEEPVEERTSRDSHRRSSDQRSSSSSRRRHDSNRSNSRDRSRERRDPRLRNRSPPPPRRRSPPPRNRTKDDFLEQLRQTLGDKGQDTSFLDNFDRNARNRNDNGLNRYGQPKYGQQQQQNMMMNNYQNMMPNMMQYQQFNQPMQYDMYGNPMMVPPLMNMDVPQPVPPPSMQEVPPGTMMDIPPSYMSPEPVPAPIAFPQKAQSKQQNNIVIKKQNNNAMNKALQSGSLNLTDILRQKAKQQQSKESTQSALAATKAKVKENCQKASNIIQDLEKMKPIMPFSCALTEVQTPQVKDVTANKNKSPLLLSDHNAHFQFQTPPQRCRTAFERNPLKLFQEQSKLLMPIARNMKMDMLEVSLKVKNEILSKPKENKVKVAAPAPSPPMVRIPAQSTSTAPLVVAKFQDRAVEAKFKCEKCVKRDEIEKTAKSKAVQTYQSSKVNSSTQYEHDDGNLTIVIDAERLKSITFEEHVLLKNLSERFGFQYDEDQDTRRMSTGDRWDAPRFDDLNNFSNPENPAFTSFSPPKHSSIFARIGEKIPTNSPPPQDYIIPTGEYRVPTPEPLRSSFRNRSRSLSPFNERIAGGRNRSPIRRNRSRSPARNSPPVHRSRSPYGRNRSPNGRHRSPPLRSRGGSPKRPRYDDWERSEVSIKDRRGRY